MSKDKPKQSAQERRRRWEERIAALRLRMAIGRELDERGIVDSAAIGEALGMPADTLDFPETSPRQWPGCGTRKAAAPIRGASAPPPRPPGQEPRTDP